MIKQYKINLLVIFLVIFILIIFPLHISAQEQVVLINIEEDRIVTEISPYIGGMNVNNSMMIIDILEEWQKLEIPTITYPAGEYGDQYELSDHKLDVFAIQQKLLGNPMTFTQARFLSGTPEEARLAFQYIKQQGYRVDVWVIGNEPDLYPVPFGEEKWTIERYCKQYREFVEAIKKVDPEAKFAGPMPSNPKDDWIKGFIYNCGDIVDVLAWHYYPTDGTWDDQEALQTAAQVKEDIIRYQGWLKDPELNPRGYQREYQTAIKEYALSWQTPLHRHLTDMTAALWLADVQGYFAETGLDYSHYFCLENYGGHALVDKTYYPRPTYHVFRLYAQHYGNQSIVSNSNMETVKVHASINDQGKRTLFLLNEEPDKEIAVRIDSQKEINETEIYLINDNCEGERVELEQIIDNNSLYITLPPYSVLCINLF